MREEHFPPPSPAVCAVTSQFGRPPRILLPTGSDFQMLGFAIMISCTWTGHAVTPLWLAVHHQNVKAVQLLLSDNRTDPDIKNDGDYDY